MADLVEQPEQSEDYGVAEVTVLIYSTLTLLAVVVAVTYKEIVETMAEMTVLVAGSALGLALAHAWAGTIANGMTSHHRLSLDLLWHELRTSLWMFVPAILAIGAGWLGWLFADSVEAALTGGAVALVCILVGVTGYGATRMQLGNWVVAGWVIASVIAGLLLIMIKLALG